MKVKIVSHGYYDMIEIEGTDRRFEGIPVCREYEVKSKVKGIIFGKFEHCGNQIRGWKAYNEYIAIDDNTMEVVGIMNPDYSVSDYKTFRAEMLKSK